MQTVAVDEDGWVEYRIFLARFTEETPRGKELEALAWIPTLERDAADLIGSHHWHREGFRLRLVTNEKAATVRAKNEPHLVGRTCFGESLDDEWLIVWLLFELSKRHPSLLISVLDNDGQFLLIEAALVLPRWLKPETSDHRVWLRGGRLHIIPRPSAQCPSLPQTLDLLGALAVLRSDVITRADDRIERAIRDRIAGMPNVELDQLHHAACQLPLSAASIFLIDSSLVGAAVQAFYTRDTDALKIVAKMERFDPRRQRSVPLRVRFTRLQYAQLARQRFAAPPAFVLPPPGSAGHLSAELGMKLTAGLEMVAAMAKSDPLDELAPLPAPALPVAEADAEWSTYLRLVQQQQQHGAQRGEEAAAEAFLRVTRSSLYRQPERKSTHWRFAAAAARVAATPVDESAFAAPLPPDDASDWMNVTAEMVDDLIARTEKEMAAAEKAGGAPRPPPTAERLVSEVKKFVDAKSGLEGVEAPQGTEGKKKGEKATAGEAGGKAAAAASADVPMFDAEKFMKVLKSAMNNEAMDGVEEEEEDSDSDEDEDDDEEGEDELGSEEVAEMRAYFAEMDRQLKDTAMGETFRQQDEDDDSDEEQQTAAKKQPAKQQQDNKKEESDSLAPVDLDLNLVKNLLDSLAAQHGVPGPASSLLASLATQQQQQ